MFGFALSDSALMGSLHNYRILLARRRGTDEGNVATLNLLEHNVGSRDDCVLMFNFFPVVLTEENRLPGLAQA
jgi:hypothetical protein